MLRKGLLFTALVLLVGAWCFLQYLADRPSAPTISPTAPPDRSRFPIDFTLPDLHGRPVRLSQLRGQVVLVNFWATWCHPCRLEMPSMNALYQEYQQKGFIILAITSDANGQTSVPPFIENYGLTFPILLDPENVVGIQLHVDSIPTSYLLDKRGDIVTATLGAKDWHSATVRRLLETLLTERHTAVSP